MDESFILSMKRAHGKIKQKGAYTMKIGAQLYSARDYTKTPEDIEATLRKVKAIGFDVIQISGFGPCDTDILPAGLRSLAWTYALPITPGPGSPIRGS
jgi:sugar phosphate isomerase/epimerase